MRYSSHGNQLEFPKFPVSMVPFAIVALQCKTHYKMRRHKNNQKNAWSKNCQITMTDRSWLRLTSNPLLPALTTFCDFVLCCSAFLCRVFFFFGFVLCFVALRCILFVFLCVCEFLLSNCSFYFVLLNCAVWCLFCTYCKFHRTLVKETLLSNVEEAGGNKSSWARSYCANQSVSTLSDRLNFCVKSFILEPVYYYVCGWNECTLGWSIFLWEMTLSHLQMFGWRPYVQWEKKAWQHLNCVCDCACERCVCSCGLMFVCVCAHISVHACACGSWWVFKVILVPLSSVLLWNVLLKKHQSLY